MKLFCLELFVSLAFIEDVFAIVYITDLPVFQALAPCAQYAVSQQVDKLTSSVCPLAVTSLESCACTQDQNSASVSSAIASLVLGTCGKTATEDVSSASVAFSAYCNQGGPIATKPPGPVVTQFITDVSAYSDLAPCAAGGLSYVVQRFSSDLCPSGPSALASCVCSKNQNSLVASENLFSQIKQTCGSTHSEDITSAQAVLAGYCGLANGTSSFPTPSYLPGNVTYYITALPQYRDLASCAQEALYPVLQQTSYDCPSNPRALVSCVCMKDYNSAFINGEIIAGGYCGSTAGENMASALSVFELYCSLGKGLATLSGKLSSVATTPYGSSGSTGKPTTAGYPYPGPTSTSSGDGFLSTTISNPAGSNSSGVPVAAIAGAAAGAVIFICFMLFVGWRYRRERLKKRPPPPVMTEPGPDGRPDWSKAELANTEAEAAAVSPKSGLLRKPVPSVTSPVSPIEGSNPLSSPQQRPTELSAPPAPVRVEVPGGPNAHELHHDVAQHEAPGSTQFLVEMDSNLSGPFEMDGDRHWQ